MTKVYFKLQVREAQPYDPKTSIVPQSEIYGTEWIPLSVPLFISREAGTTNPWTLHSKEWFLENFSPLPMEFEP